MKRLVYLALLSMAVMVVSAPAALAQQGNGLCAGATAVDSFSGTTNVFETESFNISGDTFQVAVETTPTNNSDFASTNVSVSDSNFTTLTSEDFGNLLPENSLSGVIPVDNNGAGPFTLSILPTEASYTVTVYDCGVADPDPGETTTPMGNGNETMEGEEETDTTGNTGAAVVDQYPDETTEDTGEVVGGDQYGDEVVEDTGDEVGMTELPDTGGPSILLVGASLLAGAGVLGFALLRRRA